jgi:POT family proton-dependent oligopeptide transporter
MLLQQPSVKLSLVSSDFTLFLSRYYTQMVLSALSTDPLLVWNYGAMGCIAGIGGIVFWWSFRKLDAEEDKLNNLATGHLDAKQ